MRVLFLCTGNSARSQLAEALLQLESDNKIESVSAGTEPKGVHPLTIRVLSEIGIDWSQARSKSILEFLANPPDLVISVCDNAREACPTFPAKVDRLHWPFDDPAAALGTNAERLAEFRRVRNLIQSKIRGWVEMRND